MCVYVCVYTFSCCSSSSLWMSLNAWRVSLMISRAPVKVFSFTALLFWPGTHKHTREHPVWGSTSYGWCFLQCVLLTRHGELSEGHSLQKCAEQLTRSVTQTYKEPHSLTVMLLCQSFVLFTNAFVSNLRDRERNGSMWEQVKAYCVLKTRDWWWWCTWLR